MDECWSVSFFMGAGILALLGAVGLLVWGAVRAGSDE